MFLFLLGVFCGVIIPICIISSKSDKQDNTVLNDAVTNSNHSQPPKDVSEITDIEIPIEVMPNLYSLELNNITTKHHITYMNAEKWLDYITIKCEAKYNLNGRKEGKRRFIFTSYDENGKIMEIRGEFKSFRFTNSGIEVIEECFDCKNSNIPSKISISIREGKEN